MPSRIKFRAAKLARFFDQLASLSSAGLPLIRCLEILEAQERSGNFRSMIFDLDQKIKCGISFSQAVRELVPYISASALNIIAAGEMSGDLDKGLERAAEYMTKSGKFRGKILRGLAYPAFVISLSFLTIIFLFSYLLPMFSGIFAGLDARLPFITMFLINIGDIFAGYGYLFLAAISGLTAAFIFASKKEKGAYFIDMAKLKIPVFGHLYRKTVISQTASALGGMLEAGVPILDALSSCVEIVPSPVLREALRSAKDRVESGDKFFLALEASGGFPEIFIHMVSAGEESGELGKMLIKASEFYEEEVEHRIKVVTVIAEPLATLTAGVFVGIIVMALILPLVSIVAAFE